MLDNPVAQFFVQGWPVMQAAPGIAIVLLLVGGSIGWWLRGKIGLTAALTAQVGVADRHKALAEDRTADISAKHADLSDKLALTIADNTRLNLQIARFTNAELTSTSASVTANLIDLRRSNEILGSSISTIMLSPGGRSDVLYLQDPGKVPEKPTRRS